MVLKKKYYLIEYFDRPSMCRMTYMNNTSFETKEQAEHEIELIKKQDKKNRKFYGYIKRVRFKVLEIEGKKEQ